MKKVIFVAFVAVILALFFSSCGVSPEEAMKNIQNPNIEIKTKLKLPLVATSVSVGDFIAASLKDIAGSVGGDVVSKNGETYIIVKKDATILDLEQVNDKLADFNDSQNVANFSQEVNIDLNSNSVDLPSLSTSEVNVSFLSGVPSLDYTTDAIKTDISLGITSDDVASITVNGSIKFSFTVPWDDVYVKSIDATITDGDGNVVKSVKNEPVSDNEVKIDLDSADIVPGNNGTITIEYSLTLHSGSIHIDSGNIGITITPDLSLEAFKNASVTFSQTVDLPDNIDTLSFKKGNIILSSEDLEFDGVKGSFGSNSLSVKDRNVIVDLSGISLPADIKIEKISGHFSSESKSSISISGEFSDDVVVDTLIMKLEEDQKLSFDGSQTIDLPDDPKIKSFSFNSGQLKFIYDSKLPVEAKLKVWSDQISKSDGNPFNLNKTIASEKASSVDISFKGMNVTPNGTQIVIWYEASPVGYDDSGDVPKLTIKDVPLSKLSNISFEATVSYGDFSLGEVTISDISENATNSIDLESGSDFIEVLGGLDMNGTLTLNMNMDGTVDATLNAYKDDHCVNSATANVELKNGIANMKSVFDEFKNLINEKPDRIDYDVAFKANEVTIDFTKIKYATMTLEVEIPACMTLDSSKLIYEYEDSIDKQDVLNNATISTVMLIVEGTNTAGITPVVEFWMKGKDEKTFKKISTLNFSETFKSTITLKESDVRKLATEGMDYKFNVWLPKGKQEFKENGKMDLRLKLSSDITAGSK